VTETHVRGELNLLPLVATGARTLDCRAGPCPVCGYALWPGDRVCDLPDGRAVHVAGCAAKAGGAR
jgi:hypothetical protein